STSEPAAPPAKPHRPPPTREGGPLVRAPDQPALYLAHEDLDVVRRIELPFFASSKATEIPMPGPPASVLALDGRVLVTVRTDPGLLLILRPDEAAGLVETARVELPGDAWGLAVTADEQTALVTSAWTHQISAVDLQTGRKLWSRDVAREPRGVTITADGRAYVSHLTRATLTRVTDLRAEPEVTEVPFTAAPIRVVPGMEDRASLGYTAIPSPDGERLFFPRRALGAFGKEAWNGQATVDVMLLASETSLASRPEKVLNMWTGDFQRTTGQLFNTVPRDLTTTGPGPIQKQAPFIQPRAAIYRARTDTLLIASEGTDELVELDALAIDPSIKALRRYATGSYDTKTHTSTCAAPSGVALSEDEDTAYVFCRASHALRTIPLRRVGKEAAPEGERLALANDPLSEAGARGRQLFYNAHDSLLSDGFGCAGCHPEGRDDGHVWRQEPGSWSFMHAYSFSTEDELKRGMPRQTPMLAGRVAAGGPYGWKSESSSLRLRVVTGFSIHRWLGGSAGEQEGIDASKDLVVFLREGLRPPIRRERPL
ncbi:MAG: hypothetical protein KC731_41780, partial [Myxococcales bacterium]|nr:hypothetical protein [Myxococcales bacterium]